METGFIDDKQIRASSSHDVNSVGPRMSRLVDRTKRRNRIDCFWSRIRTEVEGGAWCPSKAIGPNSYEYLEIELKNLFKISAIESQGRFDNGQGNEFAEYYRVEYQRDTNQSVWMNYFNRKTNRSVRLICSERFSRHCCWPRFSVDSSKFEHLSRRETLSPTGFRCQTNSNYPI